MMKDITSNKQSSLKYYGAGMTKFLTNPYFILQRFECYTILIVKLKVKFLLLFQNVF